MSAFGGKADIDSVRKAEPSLGFVVSTPHAFRFFGLAGYPNIRAAKVLARLSAHTVHTRISPFQAIFVPLALRPIGPSLAKG